MTDGSATATARFSGVGTNYAAKFLTSFLFVTPFLWGEEKYETIWRRIIDP